MSKAFHIGDLLSVTTGILVSSDHIGGVYTVVDFVTGQSHMTHQLPRACDEVKPELLRQHPWLADVTVPDFDIPAGTTRDEAGRIVFGWLEGVVAQYGAMHEVEPMPLGAYVGREPTAELREMAPHAEIITVEMPSSRD